MKRQWKTWTDEEIEVVKDNFHLTYKELGNKLDRSVSSVRMKIKELGLLEERRKLDQSKTVWTYEQVLYLEENFSTAPFEEMSEYLRRSERSINLKGNRLGIKRERKKYDRWTRTDIAYLEENYGKVDTEIIAKELNKTVTSVKQKINRTDLSTNHMPSQRATGVKLKCTYINGSGQKKRREIFYPTEISKKKASERAIDSLTNYMKFTDVKVVEVIKL